MAEANSEAGPYGGALTVPGKSFRIRYLRVIENVAVRPTGKMAGVRGKEEVKYPCAA
ncbi:hypothetical protein [Microbispora sp. H11081]|uniref:hypothetical protein n=1 Tax=Microbispora sp. H11081 TaxID=2729107 RepID=UPI0014764591|nr:hypothetical protein [Microbispora sp. H11081]